jgi:hypothetical protein
VNPQKSIIDKQKSLTPTKCLISNNDLPCNIERYAESAMAKMCGGVSCRFFPLYASMIDSVYIGSFLYGLTTTQKRPE